MKRWDRDAEAFTFLATCKRCGQTIAIAWKASTHPGVAVDEAAEALRSHRAECKG